MQVKGLLGTVSLDGDWVTIDKTARQNGFTHRISLRDITGTTYSRPRGLFRKTGYIQFQVAGSVTARPETGPGGTGRPPYADPNSIGFKADQAKEAEVFVRSVEEARMKIIQ